MAKKTDPKKVTLKAGKDSSVQQANRDINNNYGLGYSDVVAIAKQQAKEYVDAAMDKAAPKAIKVANNRANSLSVGLAERFKDRHEDLVEAFSDPSFFYSWQSAVKSAIRNSKPVTEKIIIDVIENRIENSGSDRIELITDAALDAASKISNEGLKGITAVWILAMVYPIYIPSPLDYHISRFEEYWKLVSEKYGLPSDGTWLDDISILGLARVHDSSISNIGPFFDVIKQHFKVYLYPGIPNEQYEQLVKPIREIDATIDQFFQPHPLKENYIEDAYRWRKTLCVAPARGRVL